MTRYRHAVLALLGLCLLTAALAQAARTGGPIQSAHVSAPSARDAGRYLIVVGGCNNCHTPDWRKSNGTLDEKQWLTGNLEGFKGAWGTSYASNLRLYVRTLSEKQWVQMFRMRTQKPPMPWYNTRQMSDRDLRAMYRFLHDLGPAGQPTPKDVPPTATPEQAPAS